MDADAGEFFVGVLVFVSARHAGPSDERRALCGSERDVTFKGGVSKKDRVFCGGSVCIHVYTYGNAFVVVACGAAEYAGNIVMHTLLYGVTAVHGLRLSVCTCVGCV